MQFERDPISVLLIYLKPGGHYVNHSLKKGATRRGLVSNFLVVRDKFINPKGSSSNQNSPRPQSQKAITFYFNLD